jgi:cytochrome bd-type quinol oxidase subunit 2
MFTNKYFILVLINLPLLLVGIIGAVVNYKTSRISRKRCIVQVAFWLFVAAALMLIAPAYDALVTHNLTNSPPMSLFDVVLLTLLLFCLLLIKNANERMSVLARKLSRMHENLVIAHEHRSRADGPALQESEAHDG